MSTDLEPAVRSYAGYLDDTLPTITADEVRATATERLGSRRPQPLWYRRPAVVFTATLIAILLVALTPVVLLNADRADVTDQPVPTSVTSQPIPTAPQPAERTVYPDGPIGYGTGPQPDGHVFAVNSGGVLWAWDEFGGQIWRHTGDGWEALPIAPGEVMSVRYGGGTLWANIETDFGSHVLHRLDGSEWVRPEGTRTGYSFAVDPTSGVVWIEQGERLYRWDDGVLADVGGPDAVEDGFSYVGDITVTGDGDVWSSGFYGYTPHLGSLATYRDDPGEWEIVKPWKDEPIPSTGMAATGSGGLWVILADNQHTWDESRTIDWFTLDWALAYRDGGTGEWTVYDTGLPEGEPIAVAADDTAVWLAMGGETTGYLEPVDGVYRFDGSTWTRYLEGAEVRDVVVGPDGVAWYTVGGLSPLEQR